MPGKPSAGRPDCRGLTHAGKPCKKKAAAGSAYCGVHGGAQRKIGAPTKLDDAMVNSITEVVEKGVTWDVAAQSVGIHPSTLHLWRERGEEDHANGTPSVFAMLFESLTRATATAEASLVATIRNHAPTDWRAAAFLLERRAPTRWARRDHLDVTAAGISEPRVVAPADDSKRDAILAILAKATAPPAGADT